MNRAAQIHLYRPQQTRPEDLEAIFVAREPLVNDILTRLGQWRPSGSRQHYLLIGPRGIGKTCVLQIIQHRVRRGPLGATWIPIALPEEGYGLKRLPDLLLQTLEALGQETNDEDVCSAHRNLRWDTDDRRVTDLALDAFRRFHRRTGKCILLMFENVNRILDQNRGRNSQNFLLRKTLIEEDWLVAIATSPTFVNAVTQPEEPLFEFFQVKPLGELTLDEQAAMLGKLAALDNNKDFEDYLRRFRSRLQALYHFTGGNPRLAVMLYDLIAHQRITDVQAELDSLLDKLTPFYQDRMGDLADQEAQLLEQMALLPEGCTPTELAREARMPAKTVRALLVRLERAGYVRREQRKKKKTVYIIPERFFRIWHQLTHSRPARGRVQYLLEFFSTWYASREERDQVWRELSDKFSRGLAEEDEHQVEDLAEYMQYIAAVSEGKEKYEREFGALRLVVSQKGIHAAESQLSVLDLEHAEDPDYHLAKGRFLASVVGDRHRALSALDVASRLAPRDPIVDYNRAVVLDHWGFVDEATSAYEQAAIRLAGQRTTCFSEETGRLLLQKLRRVNDRVLVYAAAHLLGRLADRSAVGGVAAVARTSAAPWRRRCCARALGLLGGQQAIDALRHVLKDEADEVRGSAATALGRLGSGAAVGPLIGCLGDKAHNVRGSAATALGRLHSRAAVGPLIECLGDKGSDVRGSAATALGRLRSKAAVGPLIGCLSDKAHNVRGSAATALGRLGSEAAVAPLIGCLSDKARNVRGSAAAALGRLRSEAAVGPLIGCLSDKAHNVRGSAATALGGLRSEAAVGPLIGCLSDKGSDVRGSAATALGRLGSRGAVGPLIQCLNDKASDVRGSAATALGSIRSDPAVPPLLELVRSRSGNERLRAVTALGRIAVSRPIRHSPEILDVSLALLPVDYPQILTIARQFLHSAFRSADVELIRQSIDIVLRRIEDGSEVFAPHVTALKYLDSDRDPAVLERQHPEMREAAQLLIDLFDEQAARQPRQGNVGQEGPSESTQEQ